MNQRLSSPWPAPRIRNLPGPVPVRPRTPTTKVTRVVVRTLPGPPSSTRDVTTRTGGRETVFAPNPLTLRRTVGPTCPETGSLPRLPTTTLRKHLRRGRKVQGTVVERRFYPLTSRKVRRVRVKVHRRLWRTVLREARTQGAVRSGTGRGRVSLKVDSRLSSTETRPRSGVDPVETPSKRVGRGYERGTGPRHISLDPPRKGVSPLKTSTVTKSVKDLSCQGTSRETYTVGSVVSRAKTDTLPEKVC